MQDREHAVVVGDIGVLEHDDVGGMAFQGSASTPINSVIPPGRALTLHIKPRPLELAG